MAISRRSGGHTDARETENTGENHGERTEGKGRDGGAGWRGDGGRARAAQGYLKNFEDGVSFVNYINGLDGPRSGNRPPYRCRPTSV